MITQINRKQREVQSYVRNISKHDITSSSRSSKKLYGKQNSSSNSQKTSLPKIKPGIIILLSLIVGLIGFTYLTHVFATQKLLQEVQALEKEYNSVRQIHDGLKLEYDRMIGPAEIYEKAKKAGFINYGPADYTIKIQE